MKVKFNWFLDIETKLFKDSIETNKYFASASIYFIAIMGAWLATCDVLNSYFNTDYTLTVMSFVPLTVNIAFLNIFESLLCCRKWSASIVRALLISLFITLGFVLGYLAAIVVYIIIAIIVVVFFLFIASLGKSSRKNSSKEEADDSSSIFVNDRQVKGTFAGDIFHGNDGHSYGRTGWGANDWGRLD